jgi:hypothetical protein
MGDDGFGMDNISDNVLCLRMGFVGTPLTVPLSARERPRRSSAVATLGGGTGSTAVCNGPYSQVTSESFSLRGGHGQEEQEQGGRVN